MQQCHCMPANKFAIPKERIRSTLDVLCAFCENASPTNSVDLRKGASGVLRAKIKEIKTFSCNNWFYASSHSRRKQFGCFRKRPPQTPTKHPCVSSDSPSPQKTRRNPRHDPRLTLPPLSTKKGCHSFENLRYSVAAWNKFMSTNEAPRTAETMAS